MNEAQGVIIQLPPPLLLPHDQAYFNPDQHLPVYQHLYDQLTKYDEIEDFDEMIVIDLDVLFAGL